MPLATVKPQTRILPGIPAETFIRDLDVTAAVTSYYPLTFAGFDSTTGFWKKFDGTSATTYFDGVFDIDHVRKEDPAAAGVRRLRTSKPVLLEVAVPAGGVLPTDTKKPVYAVSGSDFEVSLTPPASGFTEAIGYIEDVVSAKTVTIRPRYKKQPGYGGGALTTLNFAVDLASIANGDVVTNYTPGFAGRVRSWSFVVNKPVTTAAKAATFNLEVNTTDLTGGLIALTSANATPKGKVIAATAITAGNAFGATDTISIEASSVTAFSEGTGSFQILIEAAATN